MTVPVTSVQPPKIDISIKTTSNAKSPNDHIFNVKPHHSEHKFDYRNIPSTNVTQQNVLFEHMSELHLTRSKYIITSLVHFDEYYKGFTSLEQFANKLIDEITNLANTTPPYWILEYHMQEQENLDRLFEVHRNEAQSLVAIIEDQKQHFNKLLDHITTHDETVDKPRRVKRGLIHKVFNFLFGSGGSDQETINQIKKNLEILEDNQNMLGDELMRQLEMISDNNLQISKNRDVLNTLNRELLQMNRSLSTIALDVQALEFSKNFILAILQVRNRLDTVRDGLDSLRADIKKIQQYMTSLATHKVTPNLISPFDLRNILNDVSNRLQANPKLMLPVSEEADIWSYYQFMRVEAFVQQDMLIVVLVLPLIDKDLQFDLFRAYNLPLLHPQLKKVFTYELESPYIALRHDGNYLTIPTHDDVLTCTISAGHFCNLNTPLYPTKTTTFCIYHLLVNDKEKIEQHCELNVLKYKHDSAISLDQNVWALSVLEPMELHVTCLTDSYQIKVQNNFQVIELDNSCQAYSPNLILPSGNVIKEHRNGSLTTDRFFNFQAEYTKIPNFFLMNVLNITRLTDEELDRLANDLPPLKRIPVKNVSALLVPIDRNYPFVMPTYAYVLVTIGGTVVVMLVIGVYCYVRYKRAKAKREPIVAYRPKKHRSMPPSKDEIQIQMQPLNPETPVAQTQEKRVVTPMLLQRTLEQEYNIDFSTYERKKQRLSTKTVQQDSAV